MLDVAAAVPATSSATWPVDPYRGLNFFTAADALLFGQRDSEIDVCSELVQNLRTRMLLVHGRSGTGKSSFIRAGLIPDLISKQIVRSLQAPNPSDGGLVIRCTSDPIARISFFVAEALAKDSLFEDLSEETRKAVGKLLAFDPEESRVDLAKRLVEALSLLTRQFGRPLLLVIDQGEEVLALPGSGRKERDAFFWFLEELCWQTKIGLKIIFVLRTEYFGQFCDYFKLEPQTKLSTGYSGVEQFMLHGIRTQGGLASTILLPTTDKKNGDSLSAREFYGFEFAPRLAEQIADDLIKHCGESSTLPVMQIVCAQLYETMLARGDNAIELEDYKDLGFISGALDAFVESRIKQSIEKARGDASEDCIKAWRGVLGSLVAKQEGGALTTLIVSGEKLIRAARDCGLRGPLAKIIRNMAHERTRLLRSIDFALDRARPRKTRDYSLGHDALAIALLPWVEVYEQLAQSARDATSRMRRIKVFSSAVLAISAIVVVLFFSQRIGTFETLQTFANLERSGNYTQRLLLLNASLEQAEWPTSLWVDRTRTVNQLKETLKRSPVVSIEGEAVGLHPSGTALAIMNDTSVRVSPIATWVDPSAARTEYTIGVKFVPSDDSAPSSMPFVPVVGFVKGLEAPVAYKNGQIYYWLDGQAHDVRLSTILPEAFLKADVPLGIDMAGGAIRVFQWRFSVLEQQYVVIDFDKARSEEKRFRAGEVQKISWASLSPPTFSVFTTELATLERVRKGGRVTPISIVSRNDFLRPNGKGEPFGQTHFSHAAQEKDADPSPQQPEGFAQAVAFPVGAPGMVTRSDKYTLEHFGAPQTNPVPFEIPETLQTPPQRPTFFALRPLLAAHRGANNRWQFAWMGSEGVYVMESAQNGAESKALVPSLYVGSTGPDTGRLLAFTSYGQFLLLGSQRSFRDKVTFRIYDLSDKRMQLIDGMNIAGVQREACLVAALEQTSVRSPAANFIRPSLCD
jgi:hypothetical protein